MQKILNNLKPLKDLKSDDSDSDLSFINDMCELMNDKDMIDFIDKLAEKLSRGKWEEVEAELEKVREIIKKAEEEDHIDNVRKQQEYESNLGV